YAQALAARDLTFAEGLLVSSPDRTRWGQTDYVRAGNRDFGEVFSPDLSIPLPASLARLCGTVTTLDIGTVNETRVAQWLQCSRARLAVYSGFGGEIVSREVLDAGPPLLHMHSGWLPDYRGSTTIYYSLLRERTCGVSAILLEEDIDTGPIIRRKRYPAPPGGSDVDYAYDSAIRADLLTEVITEWAATGRFDQPVPQSSDDGRTYYIIHPVLKHVALSRIHGPSAAGR
ncbi:MAG: formyltransferase family protein, partial [Planctomycetota bacterium]